VSEQGGVARRWAGEIIRGGCGRGLVGSPRWIRVVTGRSVGLGRHLPARVGADEHHCCGCDSDGRTRALKPLKSQWLPRDFY
jgi:hypothetical protein